MFIDELTIKAKAGAGGDGVVRWRHLKGKEYSGPAGGDGGKGGDILIRGVRDISLLSKYRHKKVFVAERGGAGESESRHGRYGDDVVIDLPLGSVVTNLETGESFELLKEGEIVKILSGGKGGLGNEYFKGSTNRSPQEATKGRSGEEGEFHIELQLVVDAGLIGLPNAGKSSLLNSLTRASSKVGAYPFTSLTPHLGDLFGFVLADIPGLIEGASGGKGLGHKFLRHIARTKLVLHCVSLEVEDPMADYQIIRDELTAYGRGLPEKKEIVVLTKSDLVSEEKCTEVALLFSKQGIPVEIVSVLDDGLLKSFQDHLIKHLQS